MSSGDIPEECPGVGSQNAGKANSCAGCPNQANCSSGEPAVDPDIEIIHNKLRMVKHKVIVLSGKGGVGKTSFTVLVAQLLSKKYSVGILDADICGPSIPRAVGMLGEAIHQSSSGWSPAYVNDNLCVMSTGFLVEEDSAVIWRGPKKTNLIKKFLMNVDWPELDFLLIDTPPGTSDEHMTIMKYIGGTDSDGAVIVTTPQEVSMVDVSKQINFCRKVKVDIIGVVENMKIFKCPHCKHETEIFASEGTTVRDMCSKYDLQHLGDIPINQEIAISMDEGSSLFENDDTLESVELIVNKIKEYFEKKKLSNP